MALAAKIRKQSYRVVVVAGDGEINEGSVWEAAMSASKHQLSALTIFIDYNKLQSYGTTKEVLDLEPLPDKWRSFGFMVEEVDGHDVTALERLLRRLPLNAEKPTALICHTVKGKGFAFAENKAEWHHKSGLTSQDIAAMYDCLHY
jgi:transketolase